MAIDINDVYQTVLYVLNKEQRGYIPPAEFNKLAEQAQLTIFEKYFQDLNQALRMPDNDSEYANRVKNIQEKIDIFAKESSFAAGVKKFSALDPPLHRLGTIEYTPNPLNGKVPVELEEMTRHDFNLAIKSKLTRPTESYPAFTIQGDDIKTFPDVAGEQLKVYYVTKPEKPSWNYTLGQVGNYVFNLTTALTNPSVNFEISSEDKVELINTILTYCGIIIRDQQIIQSAASMVMQENQNEKS